MPSIAQHLRHRVSASTFGRVAALGLMLSLAGLGAACSGSPTAPGVFTSERRVQTGGGGGTISPACPAEGFCSSVEITAAGGTLSGSTDVAPDSTNPSVFTFFAQLSGTGRFAAGFIDVDVNGGTALIKEITYSKGDGLFGVQKVTVPASVRVTPGGCRDGSTLVETTIRANIQNFGPTTIVERHCL